MLDLLEGKGLKKWTLVLNIMRADNHTVSFSIMAVVPWIGAPSNVNIEVSRCGDELLRLTKMESKESVHITTRGPHDLCQMSGNRNRRIAWRYR